MIRRGVRWLDERVGFLEPLAGFLGKDVPVHRRSAFYLLGGAALFLCMLQFASGVLLAIYYAPTPEAAHGSVQRLMADVPFGWLVRSLHARGADLFVTMLLAHLATTFFMAAYRPPREMTWLTGCGLFGLALGLCFSGSLLPWDTLAYFATQVGTEEVRTVPVVGDTLLHLVRGGEQVSGATLSRFYVAHIALLPLGLLGMMGLHLWLVQRHGMSRAIGDPSTRTVPFFPTVVLSDLAVWVALLGTLVLAAVLYPRELGSPADPMAAAPAGIRPEWYFTPAYETLRQLPGKIAGVDGPLVGNMFFGLLSVAWLTVPFWDRAAARGERGIAAKVVGVLTLLWAAGITLYSYGRAQ